MSQNKIYLRVELGKLIPADSFAAQQLRERKFKIGDVLKADLTKLRNPKFNRLVHRIGQLVSTNIESFTGLDAHRCIKRLQLESNTSCDEIAINVPEYGMIIQRIPISMSFETMDEAEYQQAAKAICRHIALRYWPDLTAEKIEMMAETFVTGD